MIYVTFAKQDAAKHDDVAGPGNGFLDVLDPVTHTFTRLVSNSVLDSPWGLALAPSTFGDFAGDLLVGNFGDGTINAFDPTTGALLGSLRDLANNPIVNPGLLGLTFGNGCNGGDPNALYFTAGGADENVGVLGQRGAGTRHAGAAWLRTRSRRIRAWARSQFDVTPGGAET